MSQEAANATDAQKDALLSRIATADATIAGLRGDEASLNEKVALLETELTKKDEALNAKDSEITIENRQLTRTREELNVERERNAALAPAQDLIAARNFHLVDVYDTDPDPKRRKAFGRILYTEGKPLIFYAYDLADPGQRTFHVWGQKVGDDKTIRSLGIFASDNIPDRRWRLTLDDPRVLTQINTVFVTVESGKKVVTKPSDERVLYARLNIKANHP